MPRRGVPSWWPRFCLTFDLVGAYLAWLLGFPRVWRGLTGGPAAGKIVTDPKAAVTGESMIRAPKAAVRHRPQGRKHRLPKRGSHNRPIIHSVGSSGERSLEVHGSGGLLT